MMRKGYKKIQRNTSRDVIYNARFGQLSLGFSCYSQSVIIVVYQGMLYQNRIGLFGSLEMDGTYVVPMWYSVLYFRFESSSHALSMSAYLREQRRELYSRSGELQGK